MIRVTCPNCGTKLKAPDEAARRETVCPKCGAAMTVPEAVYDAEAVPEPGAPAEGVYEVGDVPAQKAASADERRPCPMCGEMIIATAAKCRYCGEVFDASLRKAGALQGGSHGPGSRYIPNYLAQAIIVTLFCCLPFGIPAIVFASQVNNKIAFGDIQGAIRASNQAKMWSWISFGVGLGWIVVYIGLVVVAGLASH
jgi:predicted RNA-binding Zn-ribbon protein involved in translation (DUF1610 family)